MYAAFLAGMLVALAFDSVLAQEEPIEPSQSNPLELDAGYLNLSALALGKFKAEHKNWRCFKAIMYRQGENWLISFVPKDGVQEKGDVLVMNASKCGQGLTYILDDKGKIVEWFRHR